MTSENLVQGFFDPFLHKNLPFLSSNNDQNHEEGDSFEDETLKLISQILMEEDDLENKPCMEQESLALQATERSFYDVLGKTYPPREERFDLCRISDSPDGNSLNNGYICVSYFGDLDWVNARERVEQSFNAGYAFKSALQSINSRKFPSEIEGIANFGKQFLKRENSPNGLGEDSVKIDERNKNKQLANSYKWFDDESDMFDEVLLCPQPNHHLDHELSQFDNDLDKDENKRNTKKPKGRKDRNKRRDSNKEVVDLTTLLIQCAQAISISDMRNADELLKKIRQHSSPFGDGYERAAHYFANALDARLAGTETSLYTAFHTRSWAISAADVLKGYQTYIKVSPFNKMSNLFANKSIAKVAEKATRVHIIDLGIMYGFQYPCLIQQLSERQGGPPKLRITGIDFPQPGFRPADRIEETGDRLAKYCRRFNVPFEYTAIAKEWETINLNDIKIEQDEVLVVNSLYRLRNVQDETVIESSPRDAVLSLVKRIKPDMFIHGVLNGSYNSPFFVTRFKGALSSFCARFDMFEVNAPREEQGRMLIERELYGGDIMNVVACEGRERVERPESYKQWHFRSQRAGLRPVSLDREIVKKIRDKVKAHYHKEYVVDEDSNWMLQGWKGRIIYACSCWKPVN